MKIFVSICSYRDKLLHFTLESLIANKSHMHEATYSILEQNTYEESLSRKYPELIDRPDVVYKLVQPIVSDGVGWARKVNSLNVRDEDFIYQIDSHMLFDHHWDRALIEDYRQAVNLVEHDQVVITGSCKNFDLVDEVPQWDALQDITCEVKYFQYDKRTDLLAPHGDIMAAKSSVSPAIHICAGNFFAPIEWLDDVGINHKIYFEGEEQLMSLASFAAGYELFHPRRISCYHYVGAGNYPTKQWYEPVITMDEYGLRVWRSICTWKNYLYNVDGEVLKAYYEKTGVDYINQKLDDRALAKQAPHIE